MSEKIPAITKQIPEMPLRKISQYRHRHIAMMRQFVDGFQVGALVTFPYAFYISTTQRNFKKLLKYPAMGGAAVGAYFLWTCLFRHEI